MLHKVLIFLKKFNFYNVRNKHQDFHTNFGFIKKDDLDKNGEIVKSSIGNDFIVFNPSFIDNYKTMKRAAQIIPLKEIGTIITECGLNKDSVVLDAGAGSGGLSLYLANIVKKVYTCDINEDHLTVVQENKKDFGFENLEILKQDVYLGIEQKELDAIIFDLPEPTHAIEHAIGALKVGGFLVVYNPNLNQLQQVAIKAKEYDKLMHMKSLECMQRVWKIDDRRIRPEGGEVHSGFLMFYRKVLN